MPRGSKRRQPDPTFATQRRQPDPTFCQTSATRIRPLHHVGNQIRRLIRRLVLNVGKQIRRSPLSFRFWALRRFRTAEERQRRRHDRALAAGQLHHLIPRILDASSAVMHPDLADADQEVPVRPCRSRHLVRRGRQFVQGDQRRRGLPLRDAVGDRLEEQMDAPRRLRVCPRLRVLEGRVAHRRSTNVPSPRTPPRPPRSKKAVPPHARACVVRGKLRTMKPVSSRPSCTWRCSVGALGSRVATRLCPPFSSALWSHRILTPPRSGSVDTPRDVRWIRVVPRRGSPNRSKH